MSQDKNKQIELRILLNDFFQDVDNEAQIDSRTANAIVDVHLKKFESFISSELKRQREEVIKNLVTIRDGELSDTSMMKSRAAYNINLLIGELQKK